MAHSNVAVPLTLVVFVRLDGTAVTCSDGFFQSK